MAQPIKLSPQDLRNRFSAVTRDDLINQFDRMRMSSQTITGRIYTHFIPNLSPYEKMALTDTDLQVFCPIRECNCSDAMSRCTRNVVELKLLEKVEQVFDKNKPLTVYGYGSGCCYPELSALRGLAEKGYDVRQIVLVDKEYAKSKGLSGMDEKFALDQFKVIIKRLFPNAIVEEYAEESIYLDEIKISKQQKPDIILCVDVESAAADSRKKTYSQMLESPNHQCIFAYHNHLSLMDTSRAITVIETIQGHSAEPLEELAQAVKVLKI